MRHTFLLSYSNAPLFVILIDTVRTAVVEEGITIVSWVLLLPFVSSMATCIPIQGGNTSRNAHRQRRGRDL